MTPASAWYESGTFWSAAGTTVALTAAIAAAWRAITPRRRLFYGMRAVAPLLSHAAVGMRSDLELLHRGKPLTDPNVVTVELASRGRLDIPSEAYDSNRPLQIDVGARIAEVLNVTSEPAIVPVPKITHDRSTLQIGPSLIGKRQQVTIALLTCDRMPRLTCRSPLINVKVSERSYEVQPPIWTLRLLLIPAVIGIVLAVLIGFLVSNLASGTSQQHVNLVHARHEAVVQSWE